MTLNEARNDPEYFREMIRMAQAKIRELEAKCAEMQGQLSVVWDACCEVGGRGLDTIDAHAILHALSTDCGKGWKSPEEYAALEAKCDALWRELVSHREKAHGNYWGWQGDGEDQVETLVCPVLIHASDLRKILKERDEAQALEATYAEVRELLQPLCGYCGPWSDVAHRVEQAVASLKKRHAKNPTA